VVEQYQQLARLVDELREALKTKTAFAALQQELDIARTMQQSILPSSLPARPEFSVCGRMIPAEEIGGDFYDFYHIDHDHVAVVIADVSGKGVPAAFFMAISRTLLRATAALTPSVAACMTKLNDLLVDENEQSMFVTLFYGILELSTQRFTYVNAGHNPPIRLGADGKATFLEGTGGVAAAVVPGLSYEEHVVHLSPGDTLFLYTDGFTEATTLEGEPFGEDRLLAELQPHAATPVDRVADLVIARIKDFEAGTRQADDITCVVLRLEPEARPHRAAAQSSPSAVESSSFGSPAPASVSASS
jgi:serine phosphatase RsbU (regulator of sigma subunit)